MDQSEPQPIAADLAAQVAFAKDRVAKGYRVIAASLSWADTKVLKDALQSQGVDATGIALDPLSKTFFHPFDADTVVILGDSSPAQTEAAQPLVDLIEEKVRTGRQGVHVYLVKGPEFKLLQGPEGLIPQRRKPQM